MNGSESRFETQDIREDHDGSQHYKDNDVDYYQLYMSIIGLIECVFEFFEQGSEISNPNLTKPWQLSNLDDF